MKIKINPKLTLFAVLFTLIFVSCKENNAIKDYKYADKPAAISCNGVNSKLLNEAIYSFENDILNFYGKGSQNTSLVRAYMQIVRTSVYSKLKFDQIVSKHTYQVFKALKNETDLWDTNNPKSHLNYSSKTMKCISSNLKDPALKTTLNALLSTKTMSPKLFGAPLSTKYSSALNDKYLALYIALDLFYGEMFDFDFSQVDFDKPTEEEKVDFNKTPKPEPIDPHSGHNHD